MELKVGMKAIIVNSQHHAEYNFQICEIESIENEKRVWVLLDFDNYTSKFCVAENELIPLVYENPKDLKKYGTAIEDMAKLFAEYKGYYDTICKMANEVLHKSDEKDKKHRREIDEKNCQIAEMQSRIDCLKAELEDSKSEKQELPFEPIDVAKMLIESKYTYENDVISKAIHKSDTSTVDRYKVSDLRQIAEYLLVYCNHNSEDKGGV